MSTAGFVWDVVREVGHTLAEQPLVMPISFGSLVRFDPDPVGFPRGHVFQYDAKFEKDIARGEIDWTRLKPYEAKEKSEAA